jgi:CheY-like chemotaxis protein
MEARGGELRVRLESAEVGREDLANQPGVDPGPFVKLTIGDTGTGIDPAIRVKIFDPYFTTKETGRGTGLGLSIVHSIVTGHGGFITVDSKLGKGSEFQVYFPLAQHQYPQERKRENETISGGHERLLFVDDEKLICEMGQDMLSRLGYDVTIRQSGIEALEKFEYDPDYFDLVITDMTMPTMTGEVLAQKILQIRPMMKIILLTGYSSMISEKKAKSLGIKEYCLKPLLRADIAHLIRKVLDERA